jgi:hypothetical protein
MTTKALALLLLSAAALTSDDKLVQPRFTADNQLIRPEGYRSWMFVGANMNMGYSEGQPAPKVSQFHNIYIQPEAYRQFAATGTFPNGTMLIMEKVTAGTNASINRRGQFQDEFVGIEASVKDDRFEGKWAYFDFVGTGGPPLAQSKAFPKKACWNCHNEHAAVDNVFVQFYPVLRAARPKR